jgi:hypothetical protein
MVTVQRIVLKAILIVVAIVLFVIGLFLSTMF